MTPLCCQKNYENKNTTLRPLADVLFDFTHFIPSLAFAS